MNIFFLLFGFKNASIKRANVCLPVLSRYCTMCCFGKMFLRTQLYMDSWDLWCVPLSLEVRVTDQLCHQKCPLWSWNFMSEKLRGTSTTLCSLSDIAATFIDNEWQLCVTCFPNLKMKHSHKHPSFGWRNSIWAVPLTPFLLIKNRNTSCAMSGACAEREAFLSRFTASLWIPGVKLRIMAFTSHHLISGLCEASIQSAFRAASRCRGATLGREG